MCRSAERILPCVPFFSTDLFYWGCFSSWHAGGGGGAVVVVLVAVSGGGGGGVVAGTRSQKQCE